MEPKAPDGWERLTCSCGQSRFAPIAFLRWRANGGMTEEKGGYFCLECHAIVDSATLIQKAVLKAKQRELKELESELRETNEPVAAAAARTPVKKGA